MTLFLLLAQAMMNERGTKKIDLYLDLGNAFYPGPIAKYSSGSVIMDFFSTFLCDATLISSKDMQIGADTLESLGKGKKTRLLSATIYRDERPLFDPYIIYSKGRSSIAILGISSQRIRFDCGRETSLQRPDPEQAEKLEPFLEEIERKGVSHIILLTGMSLRDTVNLLTTYTQIGMAICGGDNMGELYTGQASRIEMSDGRPSSCCRKVTLLSPGPPC